MVPEIMAKKRSHSTRAGHRGLVDATVKDSRMAVTTRTVQCEPDPSNQIDIEKVASKVENILVYVIFGLFFILVFVFVIYLTNLKTEYPPLPK